MIALMNTAFIFIPIISLFLPNTAPFYWLMMFVYFIGYTLAVILQGNLVGSCSIYGPQYIALFFMMQPVANLIIMIIKLILQFTKLSSFYLDFSIIWGLFILTSIGLSISFVSITQTKNFKKFQAAEEDLAEGETKTIDFMLAFKSINWEMSQIFLGMFITFLVFPGIIFNLQPSTLFTAEQYINTANFCSASADFCGRLFASYPFNKLLTQVYSVMGVIVSSFLIYVYFSEVYLMYEGLAYSFYVFTFFLIYRGSTGIGYYMIQAGVKSTEKTQEAIGILMTNSLIGGIAFGNVISTGMSFIKDGIHF